MTKRAPIPEVFVDALQSALQDLYNPATLRSSPLLALFAADKHDPLAVTRKVLTNAIKALKPASNVPLHADAWRVYHILTYRYVEQLAQKEVAAELALSVRQLRRLEHEALQVLADYLWTRNDLAGKADGLLAMPPNAQAPAALPAQEFAVEAPDREDELAWLKESLPDEVIDVRDVIASALKTVAPLAEIRKVRISHHAGESLPLVGGPRAALRQALLNLLAAAVNTSPGGQVQVAMESDSRHVSVHVRVAESQVGPGRPAGEVVEELRMTRRLCALFGGTLQLSTGVETAQLSAATLILPAATQAPVLVIDDNADALHLVERYLAGTHYAFHGTREPERAVALAEEITPRAIVLDVMLPGIDGWELVGRLREHPRTRDVPIVICTILPQEQLAMALGAAAFLRKPVAREVLLEVLDQQCILGP